MAERRTPDGAYGTLIGIGSLIGFPYRRASSAVMTGPCSFDQGRAEHSEKTPSAERYRLTGSILARRGVPAQVTAELGLLTLNRDERKICYFCRAVGNGVVSEHFDHPLQGAN